MLRTMQNQRTCAAWDKQCVVVPCFLIGRYRLDSRRDKTGDSAFRFSGTDWIWSLRMTGGDRVKVMRTEHRQSSAVSFKALSVYT